MKTWWTLATGVALGLGLIGCSSLNSIKEQQKASLKNSGAAKINSMKARATSKIPDGDALRGQLDNQSSKISGVVPGR